jgi:hypothetical protein
LWSAEEPRLQQAAVVLLLTHPDLAAEAQAAIELMTGSVRDRAMRRYVAAAALQRMARTRIALGLGPRPLLSPAYLDELALPSLDEEFGRIALRSLAADEQVRLGYDAWETYRALLDHFLSVIRLRRWGKTNDSGTTVYLKPFLTALGRRVRRPVLFYLVGGCVLIEFGLRVATFGIDYVAEADDPAALDELEQAIRVLKDELDINVEPASPADFLPLPRSVLSRSRFVEQHGRVEVFYFHLPSQVIAKAARGLEQDLADAERLVRAGEVTWADVEATWQEVRSSPTGWLRYEPDEIEKRLALLQRRLETAP